MSRKFKRNKEKEAKKRLAKEIKQKMNMFDKIPEACLACESPFDKRDKEMVSSWCVVVREDKVNLYCPLCWSAAQKIVKEFHSEQEDTKNNV
jgi:hypothetical protein